MSRLLLSVSVLTLLASTAHAKEDTLRGRAEVNWRYGDERSILMTEFWVPLAQDNERVIYGDLRMMGDDHDNREGNIGLGYRQITSLPVVGEGVIGATGWMDKRKTQRGSTFHQVTAGAEWLGESFDLRLNGYIPLSDEKTYTIQNADPQGPALSGTGIVVDTDGTLVEEPQHGFDIELGFELGQRFDFVKNHTDSFRLYGGGYYFDGDNTDRVLGWRTRLATDITENVQIGTRFQRDDARGSQGFLEATFRFPIGHKKSYRHEGLRARLDESPERDIDIVTADKVTDSGDRVPVINAATGRPQEVLHVDNTAANGGNGSAERPFNTLAAAEAAASAHSIIYVNKGDGTSTNQNQGITLNKTGQQLIGSGTDFVFDQNKFTTSNGGSPISILIAAAGDAPTIGNVNALQDGVTISANDITIAGLIVDNANTGRDGIVVRADGASAQARNITIQNVTAKNSRIGLYVHGTNGGSVSTRVQNSITTSNSQHGMAIYDDTDGLFEVDLGGGTLGSIGHNVLAGNTLEDLAVEYDGRTLSALNNWWGQASGADMDTPDVGIRPQIYYGAPMNEGLVGHWTFDTEWTSNTTAFDRSGNGNNGVLQGGLSLLDKVTGQNREALDFDGVDDAVEVAHHPSLNLTPDFTIIASFNGRSSVGTACHHPVILSKKSNNCANDTWGIGYTYHMTSNAHMRKVLIQWGDGSPGGWQRFRSDAQTEYNNWRDVIWIRNGDTSQSYIYLDNILDSTFDTSGMVLSNNRPFNIGSAANGGKFDGLLDNIRIYSRQLNENEREELHRMDTSSIVNTSGFLTSAP